LTEATRSMAAPNAADRPAGDLVKDLSEQVSRLVRDELKLAQVEMTANGKRAGAGAGMLGRGRLRDAAPPVPGQAVGSVKADVAEVKESARR
jgi:Putative Actinobacterial Holin-X, holin superfamily III